MYLIQMCLLFLQTMVSLANELPIVLENKVNLPCMYSFVYIVYLKIMLITYVNLSDSRPIIQSATLLIEKFRGKFLMAQEPAALPSKHSNFLYKSHVN